MPARSKIIQLPDEVRKRFEQKLITGGFRDYEALSEYLKAEGFEISRSAVQRFGQKFQSRLAAVKIATEQAQAISEAAGDDTGAVSDALTRLCQQKIFDLLINMEDPAPGNVDLSKVGVTVARLTHRPGI